MSEPKSGFSWRNLRHKIFGKPIATAHAHHEKLSPVLGLPVFASDPLSSVAYATEAILSVLLLLSIGAMHYQIYISVSIALLIVIVALSYIQTIHAYPKGGGAYIVASENLGENPGLAAGAALLIDYTLTVAVSIAAGVAALASAFPALHPHLVPVSIGFIALVAWANLRGMRESGTVFAFPTYGFVLAMAIMLGIGIFRSFGQPLPDQIVHARDLDRNLIGTEATFPLLFILLRAFAAGCTALTGIEAVSDGVPAFKAPESKNAAATLKMMGIILLFLFLGMGFLSRYLPEVSLHTAKTPGYKTLLSQISSWVFGGSDNFMFYFLQFATAAILILAANTAFADFPRLSSFMARDGFLPRYLARQGDRLVFHNGIILLAAAACGLVWYFRGELDQLLPLYAVGVFSAFTLSQAGMIVHWWRQRGRGWQRRFAMNVVGGTLCAIVLLIILVTKFTEGAWIVAVILPLLFVMFKWIKARYRSISQQLALGDEPVVRPSRHTSLLLVPRVHRGIISALEYALLLDPNCRAVHIAINDRSLPETRRMWEKYGEGVPLTILSTPHRSLVQPILEYIDEMLEEDPDQVITVIVPEAVSRKFTHKILQENVAQQLRTALAQRRNVMVTNARYFLN